MPWTYGAGAGDDTSFSPGVTYGATGRGTIVMGWIYPTTLTGLRSAGWSGGSIFGPIISNSNTARIRMIYDNVTTDGIYDTNESILAINRWHFLAYYFNMANTIDAGDLTLWYGLDPKVDATLTEATWTQQQAPSGNLTGNSTFYLGNRGTDTQAFQGHIGHHAMVNTSCPVGESFHPTGVSTYGAMTANERANILQEVVYPFYLWGTLPIFGPFGVPGLTATNRRGGPLSGSNICDVVYAPQNNPVLPSCVRWTAAGSAPSDVTVTNNGATFTPDEREPNFENIGAMLSAMRGVLPLRRSL